METLIQSADSDHVIAEEMRSAGWTHIVKSFGHTPTIPDNRGLTCGFFTTFLLVGNDGGIFAKTLSNRNSDVLQDAIADFEGVVSAGKLFVQRSGRHINTCINHEV